MEARSTPIEVDPILTPFLSEMDEERAICILDSIVKEHVEPKVRSIVNSILPEARNRDDIDAEGLRSEILLKLIRRLSDFRVHPVGDGFKDFSSYVAAAARNTCRTYLRNRYPERAKLKNRIRYVLDHQKEVSVWRDNKGTWLCGLESWSNQGKQPLTTSQLEALAGKLDLTGSASASGHGAWRRNPMQLLLAVFNLAGAPVELDGLVSIVADLCDIEEPRTLNAGSLLDCARLENIAAPVLRTTPRESGIDIAVLWKEISDLPLRQRIALLLTLEDENGLDGLSLLGNAGAASLKEIALVLEIGPVELANLWDELPLPDSKVAEYLGITSQQVINLRKSARKRLAYHLRDMRGTVNGKSIVRAAKTEQG